MELSFGRAAKVWWGYLWRSWVLLIPVYIVLLPMVFFIIPKPTPGEPPHPPSLSAFPLLAMCWLAAMCLVFISQIFTVKWLFKTKWSDFSIAIVPNEKPKANQESQPS